MRINVKKMLWLSSISFLCVPLAAQVCQVGNFNITGPYGFVASQPTSINNPTSSTGGATTGTSTGTSGTGTSGTGSTTTTGYSSTAIGGLLGGIGAGNQFNLAGVLYFDGAGNITASSSTSGTAIVSVGTYNVNPDCSITVTLMDAFGTNTTRMTLVGSRSRRWFGDRSHFSGDQSIEHYDGHRHWDRNGNWDWDGNWDWHFINQHAAWVGALPEARPSALSQWRLQRLESAWLV